MLRHLTFSLLLAGTLSLPVSAASTSRVVRVHAPAPSGIESMVSTGLCTLTGMADEARAWQSLFASNDVVGIKVNTLAAPLHMPHPALLAAIAHGLSLAGVSSNNVIVFDKDPRRLAEANYPRTGFQVEPIIGQQGWDPAAFLDLQPVGKLIWGDHDFGSGEALSTKSHRPKLLTQTITKLINVPVLMDHEANGMAGALYNLSLGMADNTRRFEQLGQRADGAIAALCTQPIVRRKHVLTIADALVVGYAGGPNFKPRYSAQPGHLYFSHDPVAIDTLGLEAIEAYRKEQRLPAMEERAAHIHSAAQQGLGNASRRSIELLER